MSKTGEGWLPVLPLRRAILDTDANSGGVGKPVPRGGRRAARRVCTLDGTSTLNDPHQDRDNGQYQQDVDKSTQRVGTDHPQ